MPFEALEKKALALLRILSLIKILLSLMPALALAGIMYFILDYKALGLAFYILCLSFALMCFFLCPPLKFKNYRFSLTDDALIICEGVLFKSETTVPLDRIHQIDLRQGPLENLTGHAKLVVTTAGSAVALRYLAYEKAKELANSLNRAIKSKVSGKKDEDHV